jgi:hypothetical protein
MNAENFQRYVRVVLYYILGAFGTYGVTVPDNTKALIFSVVGFAANLVWTIYGTRLSNLLTEIQAKSGVNSVAVTVDPTKVDVPALAQATPAAVTVKT